MPSFVSLVMNYEAIQEAMQLIEAGKVNRVDIGNVIVYRVKNVIRIDIKEEK